jgi:hypothetical protein
MIMETEKKYLIIKKENSMENIKVGMIMEIEKQYVIIKKVNSMGNI